MYYFTADEHYGHEAIMMYCDRPYKDVESMNKSLIQNHNAVVGVNDITIHAGDFCWYKRREQAQKIIRQLNGNHVFLRGSHDHWMPDSYKAVWSRMIDGHYVMVCHYAMRVWARSHYNSWMLYGHSHGQLEPRGKQHDIGVDNNMYYPVSFDRICEIMKDREDNFNLVRK